MAKGGKSRTACGMQLFGRLPILKVKGQVKDHLSDWKRGYRASAKEVSNGKERNGGSKEESGEEELVDK